MNSKLVYYLHYKTQDPNQFNIISIHRGIQPMDIKQLTESWLESHPGYVFEGWTVKTASEHNAWRRTL